MILPQIESVAKRECKEKAVLLTQTSGKPIAQIARELGISDTSLHQCSNCVATLTNRHENDEHSRIVKRLQKHAEVNHELR